MNCVEAVSVEPPKGCPSREYLFIPASFRAMRWAGRSAGRSLSWHGRGRGFKSHPVHFIRHLTSESRIVCEHQGPRVVRYELEHRSKSEEYEKRPENPKRQLKDPYRISAKPKPCPHGC